MKRSMIEKVAAAAGVPSGSRVTGALRLSVAAAGVLLMCAASSCKKDEGVDAAPVYNVRTFRASSEGQSGDGKTVLDDQIVKWEAGDEAAVHGDGSGSGSGAGKAVNYYRYVASGPSGDDGSKTDYTCVDGDGASGSTFYAIYPYSAVAEDFGASVGGKAETWKVKLPKYQVGSAAGTFASGANVMAAKSTSTALVFKNLCGVLRLNLKGAGMVVKSIHVVSKTAGERLWGSGDVTFNDGSKTRHSLDNLDGDNGVYLVYPGGVSLDDNGKEFDLVIPGNTLSGGFQLEVYCEYGGGKKGVFRTGTTQSVAMIEQNKITAMPAVLIKAEYISEGVLSGEFSVSAAKKVHFSKGNLTYNVTKKEWAFYENQYDCASGYDANLISLFCWGWGSGSINPEDNTNNPNFADWGAQEAVISGIGSGWRTLSQDEWGYLIESRRNGGDSEGDATARFAKATVSGKKGLMIFPDGAGLTGEGESTSVSLGTSSYGIQNVNVKNKDVWPDVDDGMWVALESAGVVFLPCAGYREGSSVSDVGSYGTYWSSSSDGSDLACGWGFNSGDVYPSNTLGCYYGRSVRLVCP